MILPTIAIRTHCSLSGCMVDIAANVHIHDHHIRTACCDVPELETSEIRALRSAARHNDGATLVDT